MRNINYYSPSRIVFGWGRVAEVGEIVANYGKRCLMVTVKPFPALEPVFEKVKKLCSDAGVKVIHFDGVQPNPTTDNVNAGVKLGEKKNVDVILGVGGGSSIDTAKCISVGLTHEGEAWDYRVQEGKPIEDKLLPIIAVSTTAGTGAEVTAAAVVSKTDIHLKYALYDTLLCPTVGLVDPELTLTLPQHITASTGWDAFCHSFEAYTHNTGSSDYVDMLALEGIRLIIKNLPIAIKDGQNREAREALHWANTLGGLSILNSGVTLPHGMGMAIGGSAPHIAHGEALAIMYPAINRWTWKKSIKEYATVARLFNPDLTAVSDEIAAEKGCDEIDKFLKEIGMWMSFEEKNVSQSILNDIAEDTFKLPDFENHAIIATIEDVMDLLKKRYNL
ncbi:MAG: iron-containing alcohol dehydrogenase [Promethearchaeota archaeon]|jgi:alcohol dehydrogenase class IV